MDLAEIEKREEAERTFHDRKFSCQRKLNYDDLGFKNNIFDSLLAEIGDIEDKKVLEFSCGDGWLTKILASKGAEVWTFDISREAIRRTESRLRNTNFKYRVHIDEMAAENLTYGSEMFDLVIGNAILHHVDLELCIKEIKRVLKRGGKAYFTEPLGHNPLLNLYRKLTPRLRSPDEKPLMFEQFGVINGQFEKFEHKEYYLTTLLALVCYFLGAKSLLLRVRDMLFKVDQKILHHFPATKKYCWYSLLMMKK